MVLETEKLIGELIEINSQNIKVVENFLQMPIEELKWKFDTKSWSILDCIAHLNLYGEFYLPELKKAININIGPSTYLFYPGFFGDYFVKTIQYKEKLNKMKTALPMDPIGSILSKEVLRHFIFEQEQLIDLLIDAKDVNLNKIKTPINVTKWMKINLGDSFRFVVYHNQRHVNQAINVLKLRRNSTLWNISTF